VGARLRAIFPKQFGPKGPLTRKTPAFTGVLAY